MRKGIFLLFLFFVIACSHIELVLDDSSLTNQLRDKTSISVKGGGSEKLAQELYSFFGNNDGGEFILLATFSEKKENRLVKKNQVAEKIDFELIVDYQVFYKDRSCNIFNKKIISKFSFVPKSFGYNFGTDRSFKKLYNSSIRKNIKKFINHFPGKKSCNP